MAKLMLLVSAALLLTVVTVAHGEASIHVTGAGPSLLLCRTPPGTKSADRRTIDPNRRMNDLISTGDGFEPVNRKRPRFGKVETPSHLTPERVHGGIE